jgi:hypothetical protein
VPTEAVETALETTSEDISNEKSEESPQVTRRGKAMGRPPKEILSPFDQLKLRDWDRTLVYLYRTAPLIDRTQSGDRKFICKYSAAFDEDQIMQEHGSGGYLARVTETAPGKAESKQVDQFSFTILNMAYPPQVPLGQWIDDNRNEQWKWAKELLEEKQRNKTQQAQPQSQPQSNNPADMVRAAKEMAQIFLKDAPPAANPSDVINTAVRAYETGRNQGAENAKGLDLAGLIPLLKEIMPRPAEPRSAAEDPMIKLMIENMRGDREAAEKRAAAAESRHNDLLAKLMEKKENTGVEVIGQFTQMFDMFTKIREGVGGGVADDSWTGLLKDGIREALPSLAPAVAPMLGGLLNALPLGPRPNPGMVPQPQPANVPRGTSEPQQAPEPTPPDPNIEVYQWLLTNFPTMMNKLQHQSGLHFGDWIADGPGPLQVERIKTIGTEKIIEVMRSIPQAWAQLGPVEPAYRAFLNELMTWKPEEAEGDDEPEPDPNVPVGKVTEIIPPVKPTKKGGKK